MTVLSTTRQISTLSRRGSPTLLFACAVAIAAMAGTALAQSTQMAPSQSIDKEYLLYLPANSHDVDHPAIIQAFIDQGYEVSTYAYFGENRIDYANRIADEIRNLISRGVAPQNINVVGGGTGSAIALLTSAAVGSSHVGYVVLGGCDEMLKTQYRFRLAGNVLAIRDAADAGAGSCRPFWSSAPKLRNQRDLVLNTGHGVALFATARDEWLAPLADWTRGGQVDVGKIRIGAVDRRAPGVGEAARGAAD